MDVAIRLLSALTNVDGLDSDTLFDVRCLGVIRDFVSQNLGFAECVNKSGATSTRGTCYLLAKREKEWNCLHVPTTIKVNCTPFLTLFPLRLPANDILVVDTTNWDWKRVRLHVWVPLSYICTSNSARDVTLIFLMEG